MPSAQGSASYSVQIPPDPAFVSASVFFQYLVGDPAVPAPVQAEPYLAVQNGLTCGQCHVNRTGGGMRTEFGAGLGRTGMPARNVAGASLRQSSWNARMYSSLTEPRCSKGDGTPSVAASSRIQPTPQPTMRRPPDNTSMVASILAASSGFR